MNYNIMAERTRYLKENQKGVTEMCKAMEEMRNEAERRTVVSAVLNRMDRMYLALLNFYKIFYQKSQLILRLLPSKQRPFKKSSQPRNDKIMLLQSYFFCAMIKSRTLKVYYLL
jgi:hypothetical protein